MLKLFYAPHTCALASHIALEEAGAGYEAVGVDFKKNAQRTPGYLAVNPKGRVPSLATDLRILTKPRRYRPSSLRAAPKRGWRRSRIGLRSHRCRRSTAICAEPCT
jgi:hypothetical protein